MSREGLLNAIQSGNIQKLKYQKEEGANLSQPLYSESGDTALHIAAFNGDTASMDQLLEYGVDIDIPNLVGQTPLFNAIQKSAINSLEFLFFKGANVNIQDAEGVTPLIFATEIRYLEGVQFLLDHGADVNFQTEEGTALHSAAAFGFLEIVELLLQRGADKSIQNLENQTAFDIAGADVRMSNAGLKYMKQLLKTYQAAIFFDNDKKYIENVKHHCAPIVCVHVGETPGLTSTSFRLLPPQYEIDFPDDSNIYYGLIARRYSDGIARDNYDEAAGIKEEHFHILQDWIEQTRELKHRAVLLDWDRTVTKIEGHYLIQGMKIAQVSKAYTGGNAMTARQVNEYLFGGKERYAFMKKFVQTCKDANVDRIVLTNNAACTDTPAFMELIEDLCGDQDYMLICSASTPWRGQKGLALKQQGSFQVLCPTRRFLASTGNRTPNPNRTRKMQRRNR